MPSFKKTVLLIALIAAGILVPLGLISGAVSATQNHIEYQVSSLPEAKISVSNINKAKGQAEVHFSIDRSNYIIDSSPRRSDDEEISTRYRYTENYQILLINMVTYNNAVKNIKGSEAVSIKDHADRTIEIINSKAIEGDNSTPIDITVVDAYLLTADTKFQADKTYYVQSGKEYVEAKVKEGEDVESNKYYEKEKNSSFTITFGNLLKDYEYAVAIQFYYSLNDSSNSLYNNGLREKTEFNTFK
jgi:hypothetical protein